VDKKAEGQDFKKNHKLARAGLQNCLMGLDGETRRKKSGTQAMVGPRELRGEKQGGKTPCLKNQKIRVGRVKERTRHHITLRKSESVKRGGVKKVRSVCIDETQGGGDGGKTSQ